MRYLYILLITISVHSQNIIIGDSQTPFIDAQTSKASRVSQLWKSGIGVSELTSMVNNYPISPTVRNVIITIGTNDQFQGSVSNLQQALKRKFTNAKFYIIQGSWGWGNNKHISISQVYRYYSQWNLFATVISTPIGPGNPHQQKASYILIGQSLDKIL